MGEAARSSRTSGRESREPPPTSPTRVAGGLLGVLAGDSSAHLSRTSTAGRGRTATALVDLCRSYSDDRPGEAPDLVAVRHAGVRGTAWLLPVAVVCPDMQSLMEETLELAALAEVPEAGRPACVAYVKLASLLLAATPSQEAVELATGQPVQLGPALPELTGMPEADALGAAVWALSHPGGIAATMALSSPTVSAAAAGLVGMRNGLADIPLSWHRHLAATGVCLDMAYGLLRARTTDAARHDRHRPSFT